MKKLSISLLAMLAVVVAVTSAFTTISKKKLVTTYEVWGVQVDQVTGSQSSLPSFANVHNKRITSPILYSSTASNIGSLSSFISSYESTNGVTVCINSTDPTICVANVDFDSGTPTSGNVTQVLNGDFYNQ